MDTRLSALAGAQNGTLSVTEVKARGVPMEDLQEALQKRELVRVRRGAYVTQTVWSSSDADERFRLTAMAVARTRPGEALSHVSALAMHGLPLWGHDPERIDLEADVGKSVRRGSVWLHPRPGPSSATPASAASAAHRKLTTPAPDSQQKPGSPSEAEPLLVVAGVLVVPVARAVVRTALSVGRDCAVVAGDAALHRGLVTRDELLAEVARVSAHQGRRRALEAVCSMDEGAESVGESRTRLIVQDLGLSCESQFLVVDEAGAVIARVDLNVEGLVVEFDGRVKYRVEQTDDPTGAGQVLWAEKRREDAIRRRGYPVERVIWSDLDRPGVLGARLRAAIPRSADPATRPSAG